MSQVFSDHGSLANGSFSSSAGLIEQNRTNDESDRNAPYGIEVRPSFLNHELVSDSQQNIFESGSREMLKSHLNVRLLSANTFKNCSYGWWCNTCWLEINYV